MPYCAIVTASLAIIQAVRGLQARVAILTPTIALPSNLSTLCGDGGGLIYRIYHNVESFVLQAGGDIQETEPRPIAPEVQICHTGSYLEDVQAWIDGIILTVAACPATYIVTLANTGGANLDGAYTLHYAGDGYNTPTGDFRANPWVSLDAPILVLFRSQSGDGTISWIVEAYAGTTPKWGVDVSPDVRCPQLGQYTPFGPDQIADSTCAITQP